LIRTDIYLSLIILFTFPAILFADVVYEFSYADMTPAAKQSVDKFIEDYGQTVEKILVLSARIRPGQLLFASRNP